MPSIKASNVISTLMSCLTYPVDQNVQSVVVLNIRSFLAKA